MTLARGGFGLDGWAPREEHTVACWQLPSESTAAATARAITLRTLRRWRVPATADCDDIVLMVDELVANAVLHGYGPIGLRLTIDSAVGGALVRCEVSDASTIVPRPCDPAADAESGRGLLLVTALAAEFGVRPGGFGKVVWFTRKLAARPAAAPLP